MSQPILSLAIEFEQDVVAVRQRARQIAGLMAFDEHDRTRIATAASEIARNAFVYAGGGKADFLFEEHERRPMLVIRLSDNGPGIAALQQVLDGEYQSKSGMGKGILGARRLMDRFEIKSQPNGTTVVLGKYLPPARRSLGPADLARIASQLAKNRPEGALWELRHQNHELLHTLDELRARQEELSRLNRELEDTNRGVVALYSELDEKAEQLRRADTLKTRFLSYVSHEFRTPLNSIVSLARILLDRTDGALTEEQEKQATFIEKAAVDLTELVNDLLDLTRVEAGKIAVRPTRFEVVTLFSTLRGVLRPLATNPAVALVFEEPEGLPALQTDEGKVAQILRNFLSNALKFTDRGEIRVSARLAHAGEEIVFAVADTGIGIDPKHHERIFEDFTQVDSPIQRRVRGVGIGLPLSKKLAELLGGSVCVESALGAGSTFYASIPLVYRGTASARLSIGQRPGAPAAGDTLKGTILIVDDEEVGRYLLRGLLEGVPYAIAEAASGPEAIRLARETTPRVIFLDLMMPGMDGFEVLASLKAEPLTRDIPVIIATAKALDEEETRLLSRDAVAIVSKGAASRAAAVVNFRQALDKAMAARNQPEGEPSHG